MIARHLAKQLTSAAGKEPVVTVMGPRQSGKTTLVQHCFPDHRYLSLERPDIRERAMQDPLGFLASQREGLILDEVQRVPELLSYIQVAVDQSPEPGSFILTGSQNLLLMQGISQTLAGRTALLTLLPLSLSELLGREALDPARLRIPTRASAPDRDRWDVLWAGFYPRIHDRGLDPQSWLGDYFRTYVERDLRDVMRVQDLDSFERFVRLTAAWTGQELNLTSLAEDVGVSQPTAKHWLEVLRIGYIVTLLPPHHDNFRKRLRKRPKLHFVDTGLACYLLGIHSAEALRLHPLRGAIFESFVVSELHKAFANRRQPAPLYFCKDKTGHEIDILLDLGSRLLPIEVKSGETIPSDAHQSMLWWATLPGNDNEGGVLVYGGKDSYVQQTYTIRPWSLG